MDDLYFFKDFNPPFDFIKCDMFGPNFHGLMDNMHEILEDQGRNIQDIALLLLEIHTYFDKVESHPHCKTCLVNPEYPYSNSNIQTCGKCFIGPDIPVDEEPFHHSDNNYLINKLLWDMEENKTPDHFSILENLTWAECFAVLGLGIYYDSLIYQKYALNEGIDNNEIINNLCFSNLDSLYEAKFISAMLSESKYPAFAKALYNNSKQVLATAGAKAAHKVKAAKKNPLMNKLFKLRKEKYPVKLYSGLKAAELIVEVELSDNDYYASDGTRLITPNNRVTRVHRWILDIDNERYHPSC